MTDVVYRVVVRAAHVLFRVLGLRLTVRHAERVPTTGPAVLAANHQSFLDFLVVGEPAVRRGRLVRFMAKEAVFRWPVAGTLMRAMRHIPVDRRSGAPAARSAWRALRAGELVGVYPEATIGHAFALKAREDLKDGAAFLALRAGVPLLPVAHVGLHRVLTVGGRWSLRRGRAVEVVVGEPLHARPGEGVAELTGRLHLALADLVEELLDRYPDPPRPGEDAWWWPAHRGGTAPDLVTARELDRFAVAAADAPRPPRRRARPHH
ncbi:lysophospholipid acyltransferase family protein [Phycicoccus flavus]|uniref:lysophospholipid acyltransferase family protein n=1 Tax=Phycicoccus flavus TaxID=2502783 RepID=UPI000FEBDB99|nr:lysophospholipid acyltransferase family protein [Phycicoccus flavus]NHA67656.1 1-acyl-sn-glycerol-3-phosphate acyltransferase [Phycicoccus flavus]